MVHSLVAFAFAALPTLTQANEVPLDNTPRDFTNLNAEAVRPLALATDGELYALNTHGSEVVRFAAGDAQELGRFATPLFPVSVALDGDDLFVVSEGTHCLVRMDRFSGAVEALVALASEPADLVLDVARGSAFVACSGEDVVIEVDLATLAVRASYPIASKRPRFLTLDDDGSVLVTPGVSGNNTIVLGDEVVDLNDKTNTPGRGLPDSDLFRLRPGQTRFVSVVRGLGSLLFAHGRNPSTREYWVLNVESINQDPARQGEPLLNGNFARNRVSIVTLPSIGAGTFERALDVDDVDATLAVRYERERSVATPFGLTFATNGTAFVTGPAADLVAVLGTDGARLTELVLPDGTIPRATLLDEARGTAWVHGWGSNRVYAFALDPATLLPTSSTPARALDLGADPTPPSVQAGRRVFYDASHSADGRFTCGHCHPGGGADALAWDLSDRPVDDKGVFVTQRLFGIESTFPYHWRGERNFRDFNAAFPGLLGADAALPDEALAQLESFVFSLQQPANPRQHVSRTLVRKSGSAGDPIAGLALFQKPGTAGFRACNDCHALPIGTMSDIFVSSALPIAARNYLDPPAFSSGNLLLKDQATVTTNVRGTLMSVPALGTGLGANGLIATLEGFVAGFPGIGIASAPDVAAFLEQFDHGIAPAAHVAHLLKASSPPAKFVAVESVLLDQARRAWIDVVAYGTVVGERGERRRARWWFDADRGVFRANDPRVPSLEWEQFRALTLAGRVESVVLGLPPGNGRSFAFERDHDEGAEGAPTFRKLPRVLWANSTVAKYTFETDQPTDWVIRYRTHVGPELTLASRDRARTHTAVLQDLAQSTHDLVTFVYTAELTVTDSRGNATTVALPSVATEAMNIRANYHTTVVQHAEWERTEWDAATGVLDATATFRLDRKVGSALQLPANERVVVGRLIVDGEVHSRVETSGATSFDINGVPYDALEGPFLLSAMTRVDGDPDDGVARLSFRALGIGPGAEVTLQIVAIPHLAAELYDPAAPSFDGTATISWSLPDTPAAFRRLVFRAPRRAQRFGN